MTDREPSALDGVRIALLIIAGLTFLGGVLTAGVLFDHGLDVAAGAALAATVTQTVIILAVALIAGAVDEIRVALLPGARKAAPVKQHPPTTAGAPGEPYGLYGHKG